MSRYLDDFTVGEVFATAPVRLDEAEIVAFAQAYDPQWIHTDPAAAAAGPYHGLIASGFQTIAAAFGQFIRLGLIDESSMGGPAMDEVRWTAPVYAGDTLTTTVEVIDAWISRSKPDRGPLRLAFTIANQAGDTVATFETTGIIRRRDT